MIFLAQPPAKQPLTLPVSQLNHPNQMPPLRRFLLHLKSLRHRLLLRLFPSLRAHDRLLNEISALKIESRRLAAELEISQSRLKQSREESQTSAISARAALDRASQLEFANDQLRSRIDHLVDQMADRLERAYGATANHLAMGGQSTRRAIFPWIDHDPGPVPITPDLSKPLTKISGRAAVKLDTAEFLRSSAAKTGDPHLMKAADQAMASVRDKLDSGEWELNALGQPVPRVQAINEPINESTVAG